MLGHCDNQATARAQRRAHLEERFVVLLDVLEHVECADDVELRLEWQLPRVQLEQLSVRDSLRSYFQAGPEELPAHEPHVWERIAHAGEDEPGPATDL